MTGGTGGRRGQEDKGRDEGVSGFSGVWSGGRSGLGPRVPAPPTMSVRLPADPRRRGVGTDSGPQRLAET